MRKLLFIAAFSEAATGLLLIVFPSTVVRLLFNAEILEAGLVMSRIAGFSLIGLGLACWPGKDISRALVGMLTYSTLAGLYLAILGTGGKWTGKLLWPAVAAHLTLSVILVWGYFRKK